MKRLEDAVLNAYSSEKIDDLEDEAQDEVRQSYSRFLIMMNNWYSDSLRFNVVDSVAKFGDMIFRHMPFFTGDPMGARVRFKTNLALKMIGPTPSELLGMTKVLAAAQMAWAEYEGKPAKDPRAVG